MVLLDVILKKNNKFIAVLVMSSSLIVSGCQTSGGAQNSDGGKMFATLLGAGLGAIAGSKTGKGKGKFLGALVGAYVGGMLANTIYTQLTKQDQETHVRHREIALRQVPDGEKMSWDNPDTLAGGGIKPLRSFKTQSGVSCREIEETIVINGKEETTKSSYCQDEAGTAFIEQTG
jgi:surface antigen